MDLHEPVAAEIRRAIADVGTQPGRRLPPRLRTQELARMIETLG